MVPALAGNLPLETDSIPPKGGTTNCIAKNSQPLRGEDGRVRGRRLKPVLQLLTPCALGVDDNFFLQRLFGNAEKLFV